MQGHKLLHNLILNSSISIHKKRVFALTSSVESLLIGKKLTLTGIARSSIGKAKERHSIRKIDRLLGNEHLHQETNSLYQFIASLLIQERAYILVDWACMNKKKDWYILRASLSLKGRSYTLYQEVHPKSKVNSPAAEKLFLKNLKSILPPGTKAVIITDAGFRATWFKTVSAMGFDWVGRIRNINYYCVKNTKEWQFTSTLYKQATEKPKLVQHVTLTKYNSVACSFILTKKNSKSRKHKNRNGNYTNNNHSNRCARRELEPWLVATSLPVENVNEARKIVFLYSKRMQIEEDFRDTKSHQYGFGLRYSLTNIPARIAILLLIAALASFVCWLVSLSAIRNNRHLDYQSNSIKSRTVLSVTYLACQLVRRRKTFTKKELLSSLEELKIIV